MSIDHASQTTGKPLCPVGNDPTTWVYTDDLTLPPEVQMEVERECRELRLSRQSMKWRIQDEKVCHFFPNKAVAYKWTARGLLVMAVDDTGFTPEFIAWYQSLSGEDSSQVIISSTHDPRDGPTLV